MKIKRLLPMLSIISISLVGCGSSSEPLEREEEEDPVVVPYEGRLISSLNEEEYNLIPSFYIQRLKLFNTYKSVTKGNTVAKVWFIETVQSIDVTVIKGTQYSYMKNESHSSMVNTSHEAYYKDEKALYANNGEETYHLVTLNEYLDAYGVYPFSNSIEGFDISSKSILSIDRVESESDYKFKISFDPSASATNVRIQMKAFGGLDDYPGFTRIDMYLNLKDDFTPTSIELDSEYGATKGISTSCYQQYTVTFSDFDKIIEIPNLDKVKSQF